MKRSIIKKIAEKRKRKIRNKKIKEIKEIINLSILSASLNGFYTVRIWDRELGDCHWCDTKKIKEALEITEQQKEYYENKGFTFEIKFLGIHQCLDICW